MRKRDAFAVATTLALLQTGGIALAQPGPPSAPSGASEAAFRASFPMEGKAFLARVNQKLAEARAQIEAMLAKSKACDEDKAKVRQKFERLAAGVRSAAESAAADGEVTRAEAYKVRARANHLRREMRRR
jgi:hypothetical protein